MGIEPEMNWMCMYCCRKTYAFVKFVAMHDKTSRTVFHDAIGYFIVANNQARGVRPVLVRRVVVGVKHATICVEYLVAGKVDEHCKLDT